MKRRRFLSWMIVLALGCDGGGAVVDPPVDPPAEFAEVPILSCEGSAVAGAPWRDAFGLDRAFAILAEEVPGFGGLFLDGDRIAVHLMDLATRERAAPIIRRFLERDLGRLADLEIRWLQGRYDWRQLVVWRMCLGSRLSAIEGLVTSDVNERENRVVFGMASEEAIAEAEDVLSETAVPREAVRFRLEGVVCTADLRPSVIVEVRDEGGATAAIGATVTIRKPGVEASAEGFGNPLRIPVFADNAGGLFEVRVEKPWHEEFVIQDLAVPADECGVTEAPVVEATIPLSPDAPPVRQVVLPPTGYGFGHSVCGTTHEVPAYVLVDPSVSSEAVWTSRDRGVVTVREGRMDASGASIGLITPACRRTDGETWVVAAAAADPSVRDSVRVTVWGSGG